MSGNGKREAKRAAHVIVADLISWARDANQGDDIMALVDVHGENAVEALYELEDYHRRLGGGA